MEVITDTKVPALRFPEFTEGWDFKKGKELFSNRRQKGNNNLPIYSVTIDRGMIPRDSLENRIQNDAKSEDNLVAYPKDIVYNMMRMWQGSLGIAYQTCMVSPAYVILQPKENVHSEFYNHLLKTNKYLYLLESYSYGLTSDRLRLYYKDFSLINLPKPSLSEQIKISAFLTTIDDKIQQLSQKKTLLEQYKKGVMQQIFSQQIRFKDDNGNDYPDWEEKKISDFAPLQRGFDLPVDKIVNGKYPVVFSNGILKHHNEYKALAQGVVTGRSGTIGNVTYVEKNYWPHNTALWVYDFKNNYPKYVYYFYVEFKLDRFASGSGVPTLNRNDVHSQKIAVPSYSEQKKIASFLDELNDKIDFVNKQLKATQAYKKGLLQQLFV